MYSKKSYMSNTIHYMLLATSLQTQSNLPKGKVNLLHKYVVDFPPRSD